MVLTTPRLGALLSVCGALVALAAAPRGAAAQVPTTPPVPAVPPRAAAFQGQGTARASATATTPGDAWIGIGLACSRCSFQTAAKAMRRWSFGEPPYLTMVDRGSPADQAGLRGGDTLIAIDGRTLVSREGGEAFANLQPGVAVRLTYRRDGRERTVSVTPVEHPLSAQAAAVDSQYRSAVRAYDRNFGDAQRELARTQEERQRAQRDLQRMQEDMRRNRGKILDSASTHWMQEALQQAQRALEAERRYAFTLPSYPRAVPYAPAPPALPEPPAVSPGVPAPPDLGVARGALRYSGRLGDAVIEARRPGRVTVTEIGDSEVVLTGGDLSVRVARSPREFVVVSGTAPTGFVAARTAEGGEVAGIQGVVANPRLAAALGATAGVLVLDVQPSSRADSLGVRPGDVLVSLNGSPVVSVATVREGPKRLRPGTAAARPGTQTAVVVRARERHTLRLGALPTATPRPGR